MSLNVQFSKDEIAMVMEDIGNDNWKIYGFRRKPPEGKKTFNSIFIPKLEKLFKAEDNPKKIEQKESFRRLNAKEEVAYYICPHGVKIVVKIQKADFRPGDDRTFSVASQCQICSKLKVPVFQQQLSSNIILF
jgi:hypothetical protein